MAAVAAAAALLTGCTGDDGGRANVYTVDTVYDAASQLNGRTVRIAGRVDELVTDTAATVVGPEPGVQELLVVHEPDIDLREGAEVSVVGTVQQGFDLQEVEEDLGRDYDDELFARFATDLYVVAVSVESAAR